MGEMNRREFINIGLLTYGALALGCEQKTPLDSRVLSNLDSQTINEYITRAATTYDKHVLVLGGPWCGHCEEAVQTLTEMHIPTIYLSSLNPQIFEKAYTHARSLFRTLPEEPSAPTMLFNTPTGRIGTIGINAKKRLTMDRYTTHSLQIFVGGQ